MEVLSREEAKRQCGYHGSGGRVSVILFQIHSTLVVFTSPSLIASLAILYLNARSSAKISKNWPHHRESGRLSRPH